MVSKALSQVFFFLACVWMAKGQVSVGTGLCALRSQTTIANYIDSDWKCCNFTAVPGLSAFCCIHFTDGCRCNAGLASYCSPPVTTTTPAPSRLCRPPVTSRLLNSQPVTSGCVGGGSVAFTANGGVLCNAALALNTLATTSTCFDLIQASQLYNVPVSLLVGNTTIPLDSCQFGNTTKLGDLAFVSLTPTLTYVVDTVVKTCSPADCPYNPVTMATAIDRTACFVESYGPTSTDGSGSGQLRKVSVSLTDAELCDTTQPQGSIAECYMAPTGGSACQGDTGAPVFCPLSTGEITLYGVITASTCNTTNSVFTVVTFTAVGTVPID